MVKVPLPLGQREIEQFPRFGLSKYARRYRVEFDSLTITVSGEVARSRVFTKADFESLPRVKQESDFHCVTTWTKRGLRWGGVRFSDFYHQLVLDSVKPASNGCLVIFKSQDGFRGMLPLKDLLSDDVLLADTLEGAPLTAKHGAPLRLLAPAHYGYKSVKHVMAIEFCSNERNFQRTGFRFMDHPRARVAFEERGLGVPGWLLRFLYRPLIKPTIRLFERTTKSH